MRFLAINQPTAGWLLANTEVLNRLGESLKAVVSLPQLRIRPGSGLDLFDLPPHTATELPLFGIRTTCKAADWRIGHLCYSAQGVDCLTNQTSFDRLLSGRCTWRINVSRDCSSIRPYAIVHMRTCIRAFLVAATQLATCALDMWSHLLEASNAH